jgi:hypothetical protein
VLWDPERYLSSFLSPVNHRLRPIAWQQEISPHHRCTSCLKPSPQFCALTLSSLVPAEPSMDFEETVRFLERSALFSDVTPEQIRAVVATFVCFRLGNRRDLFALLHFVGDRPAERLAAFAHSFPDRPLRENKNHRHNDFDRRRNAPAPEEPRLPLACYYP